MENGGNFWLCRDLECYLLLVIVEKYEKLSKNTIFLQVVENNTHNFGNINIFFSGSGYLEFYLPLSRYA